MKRLFLVTFKQKGNRKIYKRLFEFVKEFPAYKTRTLEYHLIRKNKPYQDRAIKIERVEYVPPTANNKNAGKNLKF